MPLHAVVCVNMSRTAEGRQGILFVLTFMARSGQENLCNPTAITTRLIDSAGTEGERETERRTRRWSGEKVDLCYCVLH